MTDRESITVAEVSDGPCGSGDPGTDVSLPVVELLTGRGFITGKSGSGKSNTASVVVEKLLDASFPVLIVDIDGEYYGLKEKYELLHVGDDDECDIQVSTEHAEKIASLALEENVPIILDVSSFLDESEAEELLTAVARHLFAKEKKLKKPFLLLVEEVHEYIPENGGMNECGKMLIKIGKRGRKHGLGITGISQRPADVKKDFITQCDWMVWHRLTWNNDTNVVRRVLDADYAEAVEDLDDGEGFMMTDWSETVRRVQFQRKQTFDAGATPGLDDFERPDLKSVSDDLVSELQELTAEEEAREDRIAELREELDRKNSRIAELEKELQDARDMQRMAEQFTDALLQHVQGDNPGWTERERMRRDDPPTPADTDQEATDPGADDGGMDPGMDDEWPEMNLDDEADARGAGAGESTDGQADATSEASWPDGEDGSEDDDVAAAFQDFDESAGFASLDDETFADDAAVVGSADGSDGADDGDVGVGDTGFEDLETVAVEDEGDEYAVTISFADISRELAGTDEVPEYADAEDVLAELQSLDPKTRQMLRYYRNQGPGTPMDAHFAAGGDDDRTAAYARNRELRIRGFIKHEGRGEYTYRLPEVVASVSEDDGEQLDALGRVERAFLTGEA